MGSIRAALHHGPHHAAIMLAGVAAYKYMKFRLLCWRRDCVNEKVRSLVMIELANQADASDGAHVAQVATDLDSTCICCGCPQWMRHNQDDILVQLHPCGCTLHLRCFIQAATTQCGIKHIWHAKGFDDLLVMARRFFGIESVLVNCLDCPSCNHEVNIWQGIVEEDLGRNSSTCVISSLRNGRPLCLPSLLKALLECNDVSPLLRKWRHAANSKKELFKLLRESGSAAKLELSKIFAESGASCFQQAKVSIRPQKANVRKLKLYNMVPKEPAEEPMPIAERNVIYAEFLWIPTKSKISHF